MSEQKEVRQASAMNIKKILFNLANSIAYAEDIIRQEGLRQTSKKIMVDTINKMKRIQMDFTSSVSFEYAKAIRDEITENSESASYQNVCDMMALMDDGQRVQLEDYASEILTKANIKAV
jgi:hypothetical protein